MNDFPENPEATHELQPIEAVEASAAIVGDPVAPPAPVAPKDPAWSGFDVLAIFMLGFVSFFALLFLLVILLPGANIQEKANKVASRPNLAIGLQVVVYLLLLGCMYVVVVARTGGARFWKAIHWNWPARIWPYVLGGVTLQVAILLIEQFLPLPKDTPFDALLKNPNTVVLIAVFSVTLGPLMEELFFRAFLYPVLARRFGMMAAISMTALGFGLVHAPQYANSWALVLLLFLVGWVIGWVRAVKDSVAAGLLVHVAYNGVIVCALIAAEASKHWGLLKK